MPSRRSTSSRPRPRTRSPSRRGGSSSTRSEEHTSQLHSFPNDALPISLIARSARGAYRDAESTLDQLAAATENQVTVQAVLQLLDQIGRAHVPTPLFP